VGGRLKGPGAAFLLELISGLDGSAAVQGLYFSLLQLLDPVNYVSQLKQADGEILALEVP